MKLLYTRCKCDACISGFQVNDSMCITVYYHQITETLERKTLVFTQAAH